MIENELLFLGLLKDAPKHGYDIKRIVKKELLPLVKIDTTSIYYPLKQLERVGLIKKTISQAGKRPEKYIYHLTSKGENRFNRLLEQSLSTIERPFFSFDLALLFISYLKPQLAKRRLKIRLNLLRRLKGQLVELALKIKAHNPMMMHIINHNLHLLNSEIESLSEVISTLS